MTATTAPTWKNPRILLKHLTTWAARDDTRPDPQARTAAIDALDAVNDMIAQLAALAARLTGELSCADLRSEIAAAEQAAADEWLAAGTDGEEDDRPVSYLACGDQLADDAPFTPGETVSCPRHGATTVITVEAWLAAAGPDAEESRAGEAAPDAGPRPGATGQWPVAATEDGSVMPEGWTEYTCMGCGAAYSAKPFDRTPHQCARPAPEVAHEDPPRLYAVPDNYTVFTSPVYPYARDMAGAPRAEWVLRDPATCPHLNGMADHVAGTWHCHDCGSDVYDDEKLAAIQAGFVSAAPVRAVQADGATQ